MHSPYQVGPFAAILYIVPPPGVVHLGIRYISGNSKFMGGPFLDNFYGQVPTAAGNVVSYKDGRRDLPDEEFDAFENSLPAIDPQVRPSSCFLP